MTLNLEDLYKSMAANDWGFVYSFMKNNKPYFKINKLEFERVSGLIASEYIRYIPNEKPVLILDLSQKLFTLNRSGSVCFSIEQLIGIEKLTISVLDETEAYSFAKGFCMHSNEAKELLKAKDVEEQELEQSQSITDSPNFSVTPRLDWLAPLFKSSQELEFYQALKGLYPNYFIYPNVALSNIFNFDSIGEVISSKQQDYFFKAVIDFVVYDPTDFHVPKYFFEVDSHYHDNPKAKIKDQMKNDIFLSANIPLHRIRLDEFTNTPRHEFTKKIQELLQKNNLTT
jgi:hypothetical protein